MYTYTKNRQYYEDLYDHFTVQSARRNIIHYESFVADLEKRLPAEEMSRRGTILALNVFYLQVIGNELLERYEHRSERISAWMADDEAKDTRIATARLSEEPDCLYCSKQGLRIIDKTLMTRRNNDSEDVLFTLRCPHCEKNSAFWEDGTAWKPKPTLCPECKTEMTSSTKRGKTSITFTYSCPNCLYDYKDKMSLSDKEEKHDPDFAKDRIHYCLLDKEFREHLYELKHGVEQLVKLGQEVEEHEDNKHIYKAIDEIKKPKIAELTTLLNPPLEKNGYIEFTLEKPEIGKDVLVGFSCLDTKSDRSDYDSRKTLEKTIKKALEETNWRLMSSGVQYRLGYLSGRLRAYEREEDIRDLVIKSKKLKEKQSRPRMKDDENSMRSIEGQNSEKIIL